MASPRRKGVSGALSPRDHSAAVGRMERKRSCAPQVFMTTITTAAGNQNSSKPIKALEYLSAENSGSCPDA